MAGSTATKTVAKAERISGWDFATWRSASDDPVMRSTMVAVMLLNKSPDWNRVRDRFDRASRQLPIFRKRVVEGPVWIANPRLIIDANFDLNFHLRRFRMPAKSSWRDVLDEARRQSMTDFDRDRPLWKVTLLEGLPGNRSALLVKLHHAIADGQGALILGSLLVDLNEEGRDLGPMPAAPEAGEFTSVEFAETMVKDNFDWAVRTLQDAVQGAVPILLDVLKDPRSAVGKVIETAGSLVRFTSTPTHALSPLMQDRSINYHYGTFDIPFEQIKAAAKASGHTANDVFLAAIGIGLGEYHRRAGKSVPELHMNMPISLRKPGQDAQNAVTIARFNLPIDVSDPIALMNQMGSIVRKWRAEPALEYADQLAEISRFIPQGIVSAAAMAGDVTASNIPGAPLQLWLGGAKIERMYPLPPPLGAAVFVALLTYNGDAAVGVAMDDAAVGDRAALMECLRYGFAQVTGKPVPATDPLAPKRKPAARKKAPAGPVASVAPAKKPPAKKPPAKKVRAKKVRAKKAPAKRTPAKKAPA